MTEQEEKILATLTPDVIDYDLEKEESKFTYWLNKQKNKYLFPEISRSLYHKVHQSNMANVSGVPFTYQGKHFKWGYLCCVHKGDNGVVKHREETVHVYGEGDCLGFVRVVPIFPEIDEKAYVFYTPELLEKLEKYYDYEDNCKSDKIYLFLTQNPVAYYHFLTCGGDFLEVIVILEDLVLAGKAYKDNSPRFVLTHCAPREKGNTEWYKEFPDTFEFTTLANVEESCQCWEKSFQIRYDAFFSFDKNTEKNESESKETVEKEAKQDCSPNKHFSLARGGEYTNNKYVVSKENAYKYLDMDKKMKEQLRRILKSYGLRDKYENLIKDIHTTVDAWYEWVEAVYAISRLHPYIKNEKDRPKFLQADKEWVAYVVSEDKCAVLDEYVQRHTKSVVVQAIHYLMDNSLWEAPLGKENIRKANADIYKGIKAIDEAVEYLRSENMLQAEEQKEEAPAEQEHIIEFDDDDSVTGKRTEAQRAFSYCHATFKELSERFGVLAQYFEQDELTDLLEKENTKLTKENDRLTESIKVVNQQLGEARKETERQKQLAFDATKERNTAIDNFNKLKAQYDTMKEDYDYLKREAQKSQELPKAKVIPLSKLLDLPLVGPTVLKSLIPFLKANNIVVDDRK